MKEEERTVRYLGDTLITLRNFDKEKLHSALMDIDKEIRINQEVLEYYRKKYCTLYDMFNKCLYESKEEAHRVFDLYKEKNNIATTSRDMSPEVILLSSIIGKIDYLWDLFDDLRDTYDVSREVEQRLKK